ncbi:MAG: hypothetical protein AAGD07_17925 [Planctomycetota bacterium]
MTKKFCLLTPGRSGSTTLIRAIGNRPGVALPSRDISSCIDDELVHPARLRQTSKAYEALVGRPIPDGNALVDTFFEVHQSDAFAGFKSMPARHEPYESFLRTEGLHFIVLTRDDLPSLVASFHVAKRRGTWRREGEEHEFRWRFTRDQIPGLRATTEYVRRSVELLKQVPNPIWIRYEDLVSPGFQCIELDAFFGSPIQIESPKGPVSGSSYVSGWNDFQSYVHSEMSVS